MVEKAKNYIKAGDIFQVVLSKRFQFEIDGELTNFYKTLREINPSPYMYFLKMKDTSLVGSSPEMLGRVTADRLKRSQLQALAQLDEPLTKTNVWHLLS